MNTVNIVIGLFIVLESLNVLTLYFLPGMKQGNGLGVFNAFEESKEYPHIHQLIKYLINWVAGTKLIFIMLLLVIAFTGTAETQWWAALAMVISVLSFYWRLYPIIRQLDQDGQITPKGYSRTLAIMIAGIVLMFTIALFI